MVRLWLPGAEQDRGDLRGVVEHVGTGDAGTFVGLGDLAAFLGRHGAVPAVTPEGEEPAG